MSLYAVTLLRQDNIAVGDFEALSLKVKRYYNDKSRQHIPQYAGQE